MLRHSFVFLKILSMASWDFWPYYFGHISLNRQHFCQIFWEKKKLKKFFCQFDLQSSALLLFPFCKPHTKYHKMDDKTCNLGSEYIVCIIGIYIKAIDGRNGTQSKSIHKHMRLSLGYPFSNWIAISFWQPMCTRTHRVSQLFTNDSDSFSLAFVNQVNLQ